MNVDPLLPGGRSCCIAVLSGASKVAVAYPNGTAKTVLAASGGLASPTAAAVRGTQLYVANSGVTEPRGSKPRRGAIDVAALWGIDSFGLRAWRSWW